MLRVIEKIMRLLEANLGKNYMYLLGNPEYIGNVQLSQTIFAFRPVNTDMRFITTGTQQSHFYTVDIIIGSSIKVGNPMNSDLTVEKRMLKLVEGDNGVEMDEKSVMHIIRKNFLSYCRRIESCTVDYDTKEFDMDGCYTCTIRLTVEDILNQTITNG